VCVCVSRGDDAWHSDVGLAPLGAVSLFVTNREITGSRACALSHRIHDCVLVVVYVIFYQLHPHDTIKFAL